MAKLTAGRATAEATRRYTERFKGRLADGNFRALGRGPLSSTVGLGTYLGLEDGAADVMDQGAARRAPPRSPGAWRHGTRSWWPPRAASSRSTGRSRAIRAATSRRRTWRPGSSSRATWRGGAPDWTLC